MQIVLNDPQFIDESKSESCAFRWNMTPYCT